MKDRRLLGILLIIAGAVLFVMKAVFKITLLNFDSSDFWVFIVIILGLSFELSYFITGSKPGLLVPGGIITTIGLLFLFEVTTNWYFAAYTWPIYIISVAVGLFQLYLFGGRRKGVLTASAIVGGIGGFFLACTLFGAITKVINFGIVIPIVLIIGGIAIFASNRRKIY